MENFNLLTIINDFRGFIKNIFIIFPTGAKKNWQLMIIDYNKPMRFLLTLTLILFPLIAVSSPAEEPPDGTIPILESAKQLFGVNANFAANRLDSFFATERADDEFGRSRIRIRSRFEIRERAISNLNNQYRINLRLPHLEQKFKYDYYQDDAEKSRKEQEIEKQKKSDQKAKEEAALLNKDGIKRGWIFNSDIGVSAAIPPKLVTRARVRRNFVTGTLIHRFSEQLTYITDESGLVEESNIDTDHIYSENVLFRFVNYKRWQVLKKEFNTNHGPTLLHRVTDDDAFSYGLTMQTIIEKNSWYTINYRLAVNYRRNLYQQWIYLDVVPGLDFPKEWSFRRTPFVIFQLEVLFGG